MVSVIVGLDVGGTKTAVVVETVDGDRLVDTVLPSDGWDAEPLHHGVRWVADRIAAVLPSDAAVAAVGIGAQGLDTPEIADDFARALGAGYPAVAVNDAALLVPAAGHDDGMGLISGTGAIGVGRAASGVPLITGGWGWVIGDEAGAAGIVREASRAALLAHDDGMPDDGLLGALLAAFGVDDAERLARAVNDEPTMDNWGPRAPAVFAAADAGSALAATVIDGAALHLARLVDQLLARGAVGSVVVAAGGVITRQPRLFDALSRYVGERHPSLSVDLLTRAPVEGAVRLARRALS
ncbi:BadF/BadG/BcrA/BcrD ATPase family protein [Salinibacterium soli]|uniref:BadF/BadG/BcrA/BcrD ATPase family protein n=1 Tax=Antiquaquibacter soli TaxID=3064523 RepID=A0ABT9BJL7_9MICO|nr:BadF/BadG/BcrA/BcrD ATPase family protein [Protaetiibacter sp. WY-16]MDO7881211.1 BadF/BadG/BcrA/BcrD ATPase family protein [Protaetiibacter sp. WY-16]